MAVGGVSGGGVGGGVAVEQYDFCSTVTNLAQQENQFGPVCAFLALGENPNSKARPR